MLSKKMLNPPQQVTKIAIASHKEIHHTALKSFASKHNIEVLWAVNDGKKLLHHLKQNEELPVVFISYHLPRIDAIQLSFILQYLHPSVKIVVLSPYNHIFPMLKCFEMGALAYKPDAIFENHHKPEQQLALHARLLHTINDVVNGHHHFSELIHNGDFIDKNDVDGRLLAEENKSIFLQLIEQKKLTAAEVISCLMFCTELSREESAEYLQVSPKTFDSHLHRIKKKLDTTDNLSLKAELYRMRFFAHARYY